MESKRPNPRPLTCPICTSREVTGRGWPGWIGMIKTAKKKKTKTAAKKEQPKAAETGAAKKPRTKSSKKEAAEELGLIEEGQAAPAAEAAPAEPETKPAERAETPAAQETQPEAEELKAEGTETTAEPEPEAPAGDKKEE